jgi:hypothetical protein
MKTEKEIRAFLVGLKVARKKPCDCNGVHAFPCLVGGFMMDANIQFINWLLEEDNGDGDRLVERMIMIGKEG